MSLRFIVGRAGSGKTQACLEQIRIELKAGPTGTPLILLVPEQSVQQSEYMLAATPGLKGFIRAGVFSFRRLAHRVLQDAGGLARSPIGEQGKRMLLWRLLAERRDEIKVFRGSVNKPGFVDTLAHTLGEIKNYCLEPEELATAAAALYNREGAETLAEKLDELHLFYSDFEGFLANRFIEPGDHLKLLAERLPLSAAVQNGKVWVDGFSNFTPQECRVLASLMHCARQVNITLCADGATLGAGLERAGVFYPIQKTYENLCRLAAAEDIPVEEPLVLDDSRGIRYRSLGIAHLEKHFFSYPAPQWYGDEDGVFLAAAANPRAEVEGVAREITTLCRDAGYRYREIIILLRNLDHYAEEIRCIFADYGIPVFIDRQGTVMHHPLVELVRAALEVTLSNWSFDPVFRFLKTDLTPLSRKEIDLLENYVLAHGIRGSRWTDGEPWEYYRCFSLEEDSKPGDEEKEELDAVNHIRCRVVSFLDEFCRTASPGINVRGITEALFNLLEKMQVPEKLASWVKAAEKDVPLEQVPEHKRIWDGLIALLEQVVEVLGDEVLPIEDYAAILDAGLAGMGLDPGSPGFDQVMVCSLKRLRNSGARVAFVMGACDGMLPSRVVEKGLLSEEERDRLRAIGLRLAPGTRHRVFEEQYLIYIALTCSSEKLYLCYPLADDEGGAMAPSPVVARLKALFPRLEKLFWPLEPSGERIQELAFVNNPRCTLPHLVTRMREVKAGQTVAPLWAEVYSWFMGSACREKTSFALSSLFISNKEARLPAPVSKALYGPRLKTSISGIEKFLACPFAHFLARGLRLQERIIYKVGAPELGQFFHAALKNMGDRLQKKGISWGQLDHEQCRLLAGDVVDKLVPRLQNEILISTARRRYLVGKLKRTVQQTALALVEHYRRGSFQPVGLELAFGPGGDLPAITCSLTGGREMVLTGRIDRVDAVQGDGGYYLRIIDYKSGGNKINLQDIYHGLKLQLQAYLNVVLCYASELLGEAKTLPGAMLYFPIADPLVKTDGAIPSPAEVEKMILREFRMTGFVLADTQVVQLTDSGLTGQSHLIPVQIKKDGGFSARSAVFTLDQFSLLGAHLKIQLTNACTRIMDGVIDIHPYLDGTNRPCRYCPYKPVCRFDILLEGNTYRIIKREGEDTIWNRLQRMEGETVG